MKKFFKKSNSLKWAAIIIGVVALIAWDMAFTGTHAVISGSFRADSLFNVYTKAPATTVSIVASDNTPILGANTDTLVTVPVTQRQIEAMVRAAINMVGGITKFVKPNDTVIIKPNIVNANTLTANGVNTDARVVKAIMKIIEDAYDSYGPDSVMIYVGEGSARSIAEFGGTLFGNTEYNITTLRADTYLSGIKPSTFNILDLNDGTTGTNCVYKQTKASLADPQAGKYWIHKFLVNPRIKFINVPVLKMHQPGITNALKNQIGIAAGAYYGYNKMANGAIGNYELLHHDLQTDAGQYKTWQDEEITDLCSCIDTFDLNVIDALLCLETTKSSTGTPVRLNTIIAGHDPVAVDHVCTKIIGSNPDDIDHITLADKIGLGTNDPDSITIAAGSDPISRYTHRFIRGEDQSKYGQGNRVWLVSDPFPYVNMATNYLTTADNLLNPSKGNPDWSPPYFFFDDRIDLASFHNPTGDVITYCFSNIYSPTVKSNQDLWFNCEEDAQVYLNGTLVFSTTGITPLVKIGNVVTPLSPINLLAGENRLLVKVRQTIGCYDFSLNICEPGTAGNRTPGIKFYIKNYNEPAAFGPTLTDPANKTQTKEFGTAITPIVYTWGGTATDVDVVGLPAGLTANKNMGAKTVTITGTASGAGSSTYTVTTVGGSGSVVRTGTINTIVCTALAKLTINALAPAGPYRLALFNAAGTIEIKTLARGAFVAGNSDFLFNRTGIAAGTYTFKVLNGTTIVNSGSVTLP